MSRKFTPAEEEALTNLREMRAALVASHKKLGGPDYDRILGAFTRDRLAQEGPAPAPHNESPSGAKGAPRHG